MEITKREATTIIQSLSAGVTPRIGLRHVAVGRLREVTALKNDFEQISLGGASIRFIIGRYGSGKSFLLQLLRSYALESKFVVAEMDFSPERRLCGSSNEALATYSELTRSFSIQTRMDGNALPVIIEKWISKIQSQIKLEMQIDESSPDFFNVVQTKILETLSGMQELVHGFDFAQVINAYYRGYVERDDTLQNNAIRWLRGEFPNKTEAYKVLNVRAVIDSSNYYDYLKVLAKFVKEVGYSGLLICLDEAAYLYKISNSISRKNNYETILTILNECLQGKAGSIGFIFSGIPEFLQDPRRGLYSYEALRTRLSVNRFAENQMQDFSSPVLNLPPLTNEEVFVLLQKILDIFRRTTTTEIEVDNSNLQHFMEESLRRIGAKEFTTPRDLIRDFIGLLSLLSQYPDKEWADFIADGDFVKKDNNLEEEEIPGLDRDSVNRFKNFRIN